MDSQRAWGPEPPGSKPRPSWRWDTPEDGTTPRHAAVDVTPQWRRNKYDIMPFGTAAAAVAAADASMATVDDRLLIDANTHPEYRKWLDNQVRGGQYLEAEAARHLAAYDVTYDMDGRAFGVPVANPHLPHGAGYRTYDQLQRDAQTYMMPSHAQNFLYAVGPDGRPTSGDADGWDPRHAADPLASALDDFVARTTWESGHGTAVVNPGLVQPWDWAPRLDDRRAATQPDAADRALAAASAAIATQFAQRRGGAGGGSGGGSGRGGGAIRLTTTRSTVARPHTPLVTSSTVSGEASIAEVAAYKAEVAAEDAAARTEVAAWEAEITARRAARMAALAKPVRRGTGGGTSGNAVGAVAAAQGGAAMPDTAHASGGVPLAAVAPCMAAAAKGAMYDLAHWDELPPVREGKGAMRAMQFVVARDGRGPYMCLWVLAAIGIILTTALTIGACFSGSSAAAAPPPWAALYASNAAHPPMAMPAPVGVAGGWAPPTYPYAT